MPDRVLGSSTSNTHTTFLPLDNPSFSSRSSPNETVALTHYNTHAQSLPNHSFVYENHTPDSRFFSRASNPATRPTHSMRRYDSEEMDEGRSSVSGSSVGEQDNEAEPGSQVSEPTIPTNYEFAVPKKKRTRTLTTPRQAAALHALMAQTPFPTTAMREEVGEKIGLTARKVQIWFQNQRQKSKRPVNNSSGAASRSSATPGPAGPAGAPPAGLSGDYHGAPQDHRAQFSEHPWASGQRRRGVDGRFLPPDEGPHSLSGAFWLAGPGVPGSKDSSDSVPSSPEAGALPYPHPQLRRHATDAWTYRPATSHRRHSQSPPNVRHTRTLMPPMSHSTSDRDWRTLPPLQFTSHSQGSPAAYTRSASNLPSIGQPDSPFAYHATLQAQGPSGASPWTSPRSATSYGDDIGSSRLPPISHERAVPPRVSDDIPRPGSMSRRFDPVYDSVISNQARGYSTASGTGAHEDAVMH
ncbi:hypothetical protein HWV62_12578 [Athelia sp. TMB]|nr:hypothetical protein HWV62_12578 [Athelia sp. TMB]